MSESLVEDLKYSRAERPDEWTMDRFIYKAKEQARQIADLQAESKKLRLLVERVYRSNIEGYGLEHTHWMREAKAALREEGKDERD